MHPLPLPPWSQPSLPKTSEGELDCEVVWQLLLQREVREVEREGGTMVVDRIQDGMSHRGFEGEWPCRVPEPARQRAGEGSDIPTRAPDDSAAACPNTDVTCAKARGT